MSAALIAALQLIAETDLVDAALDPQRAVRVARRALAAAPEQATAAPHVPETNFGDMLDCDIAPRPLSYSLRDYHRAGIDGPLHAQWVDKPHRLLYDLIAAVRFYAQAPAAPIAQPLTNGELDKFREDLLRDLEEPDDELLAEFQRGFFQQLKRRKHKGGESAEIAGARAMFKLAFSRGRDASVIGAQEQPPL